MTLHVAADLDLPNDLVTREECIWAAGIFEGEGTVTIAIRSSDETYRLVVIIGNTDEEMIDFFHLRWSGWKQGAYGERPGRQRAWSWTVAGPRAERFLRDIQPHIRTTRVKRKITLGLDFRTKQGVPGRKAGVGYKDAQRAIYAQMRRLNLRGPAALARDAEDA